MRGEEVRVIRLGIFQLQKWLVRSGAGVPIFYTITDLRITRTTISQMHSDDGGPGDG